MTNKKILLTEKNIGQDFDVFNLEEKQNRTVTILEKLCSLQMGDIFVCRDNSKKEETYLLFYKDGFLYGNSYINIKPKQEKENSITIDKDVLRKIIYSVYYNAYDVGWIEESKTLDEYTEQTMEKIEQKTKKQL